MGFKDRFKKAFNMKDEKVQNFKYLDDLIHSGIKEIILDCDIVLDENEESEYLTGIKIDVDDLIIDGNGHTIDGANKARIFNSTSKNIVIRNLTMQNGGTLFSSILSDAGAIYNNGEISLQNCIFKSNISREDGGTIFNSFSGNLTVDNVIIENGRAGDGAGAIFNRGILIISNSRLHNNSSKWNYGGAIFNTGEMTIKNTSFKNNVNNGKNISDSGWRNMFIGIEYTDDIYNGGKAILIDVEFDNADISIYNNNFLAINGAENKIKNTGKLVNFVSLRSDERNFTFLNQLIQSKQGEIKLENDIVLDAINEEYTKFHDGIKIDADDLVIDGNGHTIDSQGLGSIFSVNGKNIVIKNIKLVNADEGAINNNGGLLRITNAIFEKNHIAIKIGAGELAVTDSTFISNKGSAIFGRATITNCIFNNNTSIKGGAIFSGGSLISGCEFNNNVADKGGAISGSGTVTNCIFNNNCAKDGKSIFGSGEININNSKFNEEEFSKEPSISNAGIMIYFSNEVHNGLISNQDDAILKLCNDKQNSEVTIDNAGKIKAYHFKNHNIDFAEIENTGQVIFMGDDNNEVIEEDYFTSEFEWIDIKIFISSTFKDMHAERDYLVTEVFSELKEWCRQRRILLNEIDLRWGVTIDDSKSGNTINVCLKSIDECHPFFVCFIGQRRGWVPNIDEININEQTLLKYPQLNESIGQLSITEMEIEHATLLPMIKILEKDTRKSYSNQSIFFFRENPFKEIDLTDEQKAIYLNMNKDDDESLENLKNLIKQDFATFTYSCKWDEDLSTDELRLAGAQQGRLVDFKCGDKPLRDIIISELKRKIEEEFPNQKPLTSEDSYLDDAMLHKLEIESRANYCVGRQKQIEYLNDYLMDDNHENILLVKGDKGIGKTYLLCKWNELLKKNGFKPIMRICNSTSKSIFLNDLCLSIGSELGIFNGEEEKAMEHEYRIDRSFIEKLKDRGVNILILSDVDRIDKRDDLILKDIPNDFHIVLESNMNFDIGAPHETYVLEGFESNERLQFIENYLGKCLKNLDDNQKDIIISNYNSESPVFLNIILNEISLFGSFEELNDKILSFGYSTKSAFEEIIKTLEKDITYPDNFVKFVLLMLCYARRGITEEELFYGLSLNFDENNLKEHLRMFTRRINEYIILIYDKYLIRYDEFSQAILDHYSNQETDVRKALIEVYKKSMLSASENLTYNDIAGSTELLYNLEFLGDYDGMVEVFENDVLLDKICPYQYLMDYKSGTFFYGNRSTYYAGSLVKDQSEGSGFMRDISLILLKRADKLLKQAPKKYPKPYKQWSIKFRKERTYKNFSEYRDTFYEMPIYVSASLKYAKMSFEIEKDINKSIEFWNSYKIISRSLILFFKSMIYDGAEYLQLSHQVEDLALSAKGDFDRLDKYVDEL